MILQFGNLLAIFHENYIAKEKKKQKFDENQENNYEGTSESLYPLLNSSVTRTLVL